MAMAAFFRCHKMFRDTDMREAPSPSQAKAEIQISSAREIIDEARNGKMFILVDDEDRENEGDLVIPAQMITPDAVNFMARQGRGLICLAMTGERAKKLNLQPMSTRNATRHETAFTVSIEAKDGVTTGISAPDRARTITVAIEEGKGADDIVTPGHVFPLVAKAGGVLERAGHTEAAVDVAKLAGLNPSGVICEIMNDDGTMARMDDLMPFAQKHGLKIGTIKDLITHRRRHDHKVETRASSTFKSRFGGEWHCIVFDNTAINVETMVLVKGDIDVSKPVLVRMHAVDYLADFLGDIGSEDHAVSQSMNIISQEGAGVIVLIISREDNSLSRYLLNRNGEKKAEDTSKSLRDYGIGALALAELDIHQIILLTNLTYTPVALAGYGLEIVERRSINSH